MNLSEAKLGVRLIIVAVNGQGSLRRRILDMGLTPGTSIYISNIAPGGNPIEITVRGYELSMRKSDAKIIEVMPYAFAKR